MRGYGRPKDHRSADRPCAKWKAERKAFKARERRLSKALAVEENDEYFDTFLRSASAYMKPLVVNRIQAAIRARRAIYGLTMVDPPPVHVSIELVERTTHEPRRKYGKEGT